ncbi:MAG TPA: hypothetical protein VFZ54_20150 [Burkholderiales bacterium]
MSMFLVMLSACLTFGVAVFGAAIYSEGTLLALRTAAAIIGWSFVLASAAGLVGLRHAGAGRIGAAAVTMCAGAVVLYMSHFLEWNEAPPAAIAYAAAPQPLAARPAFTLASFQPLEAPSVAKVTTVVPAPQRKVVAAARPIALAANACSVFAGVESLQCQRCSEKLGFARVTCHESVRLEYCESELGDERTCPSPIPQSYPG